MKEKNYSRIDEKIQGIEIPSFFYPENGPSVTQKKSVERQYRVIDTEENSSHKKSRF